MQPRLLFSLLCSSSAAFLLALAPLLLGNAIFVVAALGGPLNPPYYIAERAVNALNNASEDLLHWKLEMLESATAPVLREGRLRQQMKFVIVRTKCLKLEDQSRVLLDLCPVDEDAPRMECTIEVLTDQHGHQQFSNSKCQRFVRLRSEKEAERKDIKKQSAAAAPAEPVVDRQRAVETENAVDGVPRTENGDGTQTSANAVGDGTQKDLLGTRQLMSAIEHTLKLKDLEIWAKFRQFVSRFGKAYSSKREVLKRFRVYRRNLGLARKWQDVEQGSAVYGETQFMDMSMLEFKRIFLPYQWPLHVPGTTFASPINDDDNSLPTEWDWRQHGAVTAVKNQGMCGSCWAFSVTGNIEGQWALKRDGGGRLEALSEQELLDCDKVDMACDGGLPLQAYKEIIRIGGLEPERDYPYDAHREQCHLNRSDIAAYINGSVQLAQDEVQMAKWLVKNGPISVGVNAMPLQFYRHGISHPWRLFCSPHLLNHGVLIVGFGQEGDKPFWIIKNSWGAHWGEEGYYRLYRGKNVCGIHEMATSAVIQ